MNCELVIICAVAANGGIGRDGDLIFHISADLRRFKALTTGHTVVMGRKTFESLPKGALPNRRNIVVTHNPEKLAAWMADRAGEIRPAEIAPTIEDALNMAKAAGETELYVIGGGSIYSSLLSRADRLEITEIAADAADADTFFPAISTNEWKAVSISPWQQDEKSGADYRFVTYKHT